MASLDPIGTLEVRSDVISVEICNRVGNIDRSIHITLPGDISSEKLASVVTLMRSFDQGRDDGQEDAKKALAALNIDYQKLDQQFGETVAEKNREKESLEANLIHLSANLKQRELQIKNLETQKKHLANDLEELANVYKDLSKSSEERVIELTKLREEKEALAYEKGKVKTELVDAQAELKKLREFYSDLVSFFGDDQVKRHYGRLLARVNALLEARDIGLAAMRLAVENLSLNYSRFAKNKLVDAIAKLAASGLSDSESDNFGVDCLKDLERYRGFRSSVRARSPEQVDAQFDQILQAGFEGRLAKVVFDVAYTEPKTS